MKAPCICASINDITLYGEQTIDGLPVVSGDRVLVKDQNVLTENGIWVVASADWVRASDFDGSLDVMQGTTIPVADGSTNAATIWQLNTPNPEIGVSSLVFNQISGMGGSGVSPSDLADTATVGKGDALVGFKQSNSGGVLTGAIGRTVHTKLQESVSVKDFGATGDGTTDDTDAFAYAIAVSDNIFIPNGTYVLRTLTIAASVSFFGSGVLRLKTNYDQDNVSIGGSNLAMFDITVADAIVNFNGLTFDGNQANQSASTPSLALIRAWNRFGSLASNILDINVIDCVFKNQTSASIRVNGGGDTNSRNTVNVRGCLFLDGRKGIGSGDPASASALGFTPFYIDCYDRVQLSVSDCRFVFRSSLASFGEYAPSAVRWTFVDATVSVDGASGSVSNSYFYRVGRKDQKYDGTATGNNGLGVLDFYARGREIVINNNTFDSCLNSAIRGKTNVDKAVIQGNMIKNTPLAINITPNTYADQNGYINISGNVIRGSDQFGIAVVGNNASAPDFVYQVTVNGNTIDDVTNVDAATGNVGGIVVRYHHRLIINNNNISNVTGVNCSGIAVRSGDGAGHTVVVGNCISVVDYRGIFFDLGGDKIVCNSNLIETCGGEGIVFYGHNSADVVCCGNYISDVNDYGIYLHSATTTSINGNTIDDIGGLERGIFVTSNMYGCVVGNTSNATTPFMSTLTGEVQQGYNTFNPMESYGNLAPTTGTWEVGAKRWKTTVTSGGYAGWICTVAGSPGTWKEFGLIA